MEQELRFEKGAEDMAGGVSAGAAPEVAFSRHSGICRSDVFITHRKPGPDYRVPARSGPGHKARRKTTRLLIVATSSGRLFLDRVGRHQPASASPAESYSESISRNCKPPPGGGWGIFDRRNEEFSTGVDRRGKFNCRTSGVAAYSRTRQCSGGSKPSIQPD